MTPVSCNTHVIGYKESTHYIETICDKHYNYKQFIWLASPARESIYVV